MRHKACYITEEAELSPVLLHARCQCKTKILPCFSQFVLHLTEAVPGVLFEVFILMCDGKCTRQSCGLLFVVDSVAVGAVVWLLVL